MKFSVEVHHGGVSCGVGVGRTYVGGQLDWFDDWENWIHSIQRSHL
jgi:hypothetical protein